MDEIVAVILLVLLLIGTPSVLSIVALVLAARARGEVKRLREQIQQGAQAAPAPQPAPRAQAVPPPPPEQPKAAPPPPRAAQTTPTPPPLQPAKPRANLEVALGGKVASFVGIATLVLGIVFFVGYAIKHGWIGPAMRITLGMVTGGFLIALAHLMEIKSRHLTILSRVLTGGGSALLFFSVFAAHGMYHLIGPVPAIGGLLMVSAAVMALAVVYRSQIVAILGVLGAFITPAVIHGDFSEGVFPLIYIAAINATVMGLGLRRNWQSLYNIAFVFTILYTSLWLGNELGGADDPNWWIGLAFVLVYFAEFIVLGLIKLKGGRGAVDQVIDLVRMLLASLCLLGAVYWIFEDQDLRRWIGLTFLLLAALHVGVVKVAWRWLPRFKNDILVLLAGALTFATLALPAQLDGVWVSLGWALEGLILALFARKFKVPAFQIAGLFLGLLGLAKALLFDINLDIYDHDTQRLFFNSRFIVGLGSAVLLGVQSWLYGRSEGLLKSRNRVLENIVLLIATVGFVLAVGIDGITVLDADAPWAWLLSSIALGLAGVFLLLVGGSVSTALCTTGVVMLLLMPVKLVLIDSMVMWFDGGHHHDDFSVFFNSVFLVSLALVAAAALAMRYVLPKTARQALPTFLVPVMFNIIAILSVVAMATLEIFRAETSWKGSAVTLWWGGCALTLILLGLSRRIRYLRYTALGLFCATLAKVFLVDMSHLGGMVRVAAFMGVGVILLVLSFVYQRLAPHLNQEPQLTNDEESDETP